MMYPFDRIPRRIQQAAEILIFSTVLVSTFIIILR